METSATKQNVFMRYFDKRLTTSKFTAKEILALYLPMLLDQFSIFGMNMLSSAMVSASSQEAISAISLVGTIAYLLVSMFSALSTGGTVLVAQAKGRGLDDEIRKSCGQTILVASSMGIIVTGLLVFGAPLMVSLFFSDAAPIIVDYGIIYLKLYGWALFPFAVFNSISCCFAGMGKAKHCLSLSVIINLVHLVMSFLMINVLDMGIYGTGYSLIVARGVGALAAVILMFFTNSQASGALRFRDLLYLSMDFIKKIIPLALPIILGSIMSNGGALLTNSYIASLEVDAIAAHSITNSVFSLFTLSGFALMTLTTTVCGQCIGSKDYDLARHYVRQFIRIGRLALIVNSAIVAPFLPLLLLMYQPSATVQPIIYQLLVIGLISAIALYCNDQLLPTCLRAAGDATYTTVASLVVMWIVRVALGYFLTITCGIGIYAVWIINIIQYFFDTLIFSRRLKGNKWQKM